MQQQVNQINRRRQQQQRGGGISCWTMIAIFFAIQLITKLITGEQPSASYFPNQDNQNNTLQTLNNQPKRVKSNRVPIVNALSKNQNIHLEIWIRKENQTLAYTQTQITYSLDALQIDMQVQLFQLQNLKQNLTITSRFTGEHKAGHRFVFQKTENLTAYKKLKLKQALFGDNMNKKNQQYVTMIPTDFNIFLVYSQMAYQHQSQIPLQLQYQILRTKNVKYYEALIDMSQMHIGSKHYKQINSTQKLNLHFFCYSEYRYMMFYSLSHKVKMPTQIQNSVFKQLLQNHDSMDQLKEVLFQNNVYLVALTFILSLLQSVFQYLAVKDQIKVWKNIQKYKGLSIKILYTNFIFSFIFLLYLKDNEASRMLLIFQVINLIVTFWKITKITKISRINTFPYIKISYPDWYRSTELIDNNASKYLYYFLVPLFVIYLIYSALYGQFKSGWYSFILECFVGFIYIFGFIQMFPQVYINYKLKSVAHLPWRTLIYKFLNTIIDDLFAFLITMPWLRRLACFRDDVIFIIYIVQRQIYRVDHTRIQKVGGENSEHQKIN